MSFFSLKKIAEAVQVFLAVASSELVARSNQLSDVYVAFDICVSLVAH